MRDQCPGFSCLKRAENSLPSREDRRLSIWERGMGFILQAHLFVLLNEDAKTRVELGSDFLFPSAKY